MNLKDYLDLEARNLGESRTAWAAELELLVQLGDLQDQLTGALVVGKETEDLVVPAHLLLVAFGEFPGVVSLILRRRLVAAYCASRVSIEATGAARHIRDNPGLADVFLRAYPNSAEIGSETQWKRSRSYAEEFGTSKLLRGDGEPWPFLRVMYAMFSVLASHAGPVAFSRHKHSDKGVHAHAFAPELEIGRAIYAVLATYSRLWRVFLGLLQPAVEPMNHQMLSMHFLMWRDNFTETMRERAPEGMGRVKTE